MSNVRQIVSVIMAGGPGERLWPLSRPGRPKPLVEIQGQTLLLRAFLRAQELSGPAGEVYLIALEPDRERLLSALGNLDRSRFIGEPSRRDTALAVLTAAQVVRQRHPGAILAVLPADHIMRDEPAFSLAAERAADLAADAGGICLLGALPTGPRTEFGYIVGRRAADGSLAVDRFVEKPDPERAAGLVQEGALWNMGVFIGAVEALLATARAAAPDLCACAERAAEAFLCGDRQALQQAYLEAEKLPFDRAVLERASGLRAVPCDAGWSDLGNWPEFVRLHRELSPDVAEDLEWREPGAPPLQVLGGREGLIVCSTPAGSLVATLDGARDVRPPLSGPPPFVPQGARQVEKPWGAEYVWAETDRYAGKLLFVLAGESLSLQYHVRKLESMWVLAGTGVLELDGEFLPIGPGSTVTIRPGMIHRLEAQSDLSVLEVSTPELDDVVRCQDRYGRTGT